MLSFTRFATIALGALPLLATATAASIRRWGDGGSVCSTGTLQCCNSLQAANDPAVAELLAPLGVGVELQAVTADVGLTCSPITLLLGATLASVCKEQAVCCDDNNYGGAISIGCVPVQSGLAGLLP